MFSQLTELENCKYIVQCILKELSMFWFRKVLVFWTWNHHVLSKYWLSTGGFVPSDNFPRRVPLPEVYSSISENSHVAYTNETERPSVEVTLVSGGVEVDGVVVPFDPVIWRACRVLSETALAPRFQMRGLETIFTTQCNVRGRDSSLVRAWIFVCTRRSLTDSHSVTHCL